MEAAFDAERQALLADITTLNRKCERVQVEKDRLAARLTKAQGDHAKELVSLRSKAEVAQREATTARSLAKAQTDESEDLTALVSELRGELAEARHAGQVRQSELELEVDSERSRREDLQREVEEYRRKLTSAKQDVATRDEELLRERKLCESRVARVTKKLEALQRQLRTDRESKTLEERLAHALDKVAMLQAKVDSQDEELEQAATRIHSLKADDCMQSKSTKVELEAARQHARHCEHTAARAQDAARKAQEQLEAALAENQALQTELYDTRSDLTFLQRTGEAEISKKVAQVELDRATGPSPAEQAARVEVETARRQLAERDDERRQLNDTISEQARRLEAAHAQLHTAREAEASARTGLSEASTIIQKLTAECQALERRTQDVTADWKQAEDTARQECEALKAQLVAKEAETEKAFTLATSLNKQRSELLDLVKQLTAAEEGRSKSVTELSAEVERLRERNATIQEERLLLLKEREEHMETIQLLAKERRLHAQAIGAVGPQPKQAPRPTQVPARPPTGPNRGGRSTPPVKKAPRGWSRPSSTGSASSGASTAAAVDVDPPQRLMRQ